jgi:ATP-dependent helicase/nuclease subunit B
MLSDLCTELRGHRLTPGDVSEHLKSRATQDMAGRWDMIQRGYATYLKEIKALGYSDPADRRADLLVNGRPRDELQLVLAGVPEIEEIYKIGFARLGRRTTALVYAPAEVAGKFDEWGRINERWTMDPVPFQEQNLFPCADSGIQAETCADWIQTKRIGTKGRPQCVIIAPDREEVAGLCDALRERQLIGRPAALKKNLETAPWQVLSLLADYLDRGENGAPGFDTVAAIARHPDFGRLLRPGGAVNQLDDIQAGRLPEVFEPEKYEKPSGIPEEIFTFSENLRKRLDISCEPQNVSDVAGVIRRLLFDLYGYCELDDATPAGRLLSRPLKFLMEALDDCNGLEFEIRPSDFLRALLSSGAQDPVPPLSGEGGIDLIGWLELLADDAPYAVVTSLCEGFIPDSVGSDPFMPAGLREELNLKSNRSRLARDAYVAAASISRLQKRVRVCVPQRNASGDPLRPSRLLLQGLKGRDLARRLLVLLTEENKHQRTDTKSSQPQLAINKPEKKPVPQLSVTDFGTYLKSPKHFYYTKLLRLKLPVDDTREIDSSLAGTLLHEVLAAFGNHPEVRDSKDSSVITRFLHQAFERVWARRFAGIELAPVTIQADMFRAKLTAFAKAQAALAGEGWRIVYAEKPEGASPSLVRNLDVNSPKGERATIGIHGRIDRMDFHKVRNAWRVIDYKTGKHEEPFGKHLKGVPERHRDLWQFALAAEGRHRWTELQFPLYRWLLDGDQASTIAPGWRAGTPAEFYYFELPDDLGNISLSKAFPADRLGDGFDTALRVAGHIIDGNFPDTPESLSFEDPVIRCLCGVSLIVGEGGEEES